MILLFVACLSLRLFAEPVCTNKPLTTLRKSADEKSAVTWRVSRYMPFLRIEKKNGWSKLRDLDGETHFARAKDLSTSLRCLVVKTNVATLHREPSASAPATDFKHVDRYTPFLRVADKDDWFQVKDEAGHVAWIAAPQVWKPVVINSMSF